jgi:hypothetical protein
MVDTREYTTAVIQTNGGPLPNALNQPASSKPAPQTTTAETAAPPAPVTDSTIADHKYDSTTDVSQMELQNVTAIPQENFSSTPGQPR